MNEIKTSNIVILFWLVCGGFTASILSVINLKIMSVWGLGFLLIMLGNFSYKNIVNNKRGVHIR